MKIIVFVFFVVTNDFVYAAEQIQIKHYDGFDLFLDCSKHGAIAFEYSISHKTGLSNINAFPLEIKRDDTVLKDCQPKTTISLHDTKRNILSFNNTQLVAAGDMPSGSTAYKQTFLAPNYLPMNKYFQTIGGAWYQTKKITQCYRNITPLYVWGGIIWGDDLENDYFVDSHGVVTPDYWWKVIYREDTGDYIAWLFPNNSDSVAGNMDAFLISLSELVKKLDFSPDFSRKIPLSLWHSKLTNSWYIENDYTVLRCGGQQASFVR